MPIEAAAHLIAGARRNRTSLPRLPEDCRPTTEAEGFAIQKAVADLLGLEVAAWKVSASGPYGGSAAPIFAGTVHQAPHRAARIDTLETEIALKLKRDLPFRDEEPYSRQDIVNAVESFALAFETVDWRLTSPDVGYLERLADCFANEGLILGREVPFAADLGSPVGDVRLWCNGAAEAFSPVDIDPVEAVRAYVNRGGDLFGGPKAGQWILTGSLTGMQKVAAPATWHATWRDLTEVSVEVTG